MGLFGLFGPPNVEMMKAKGDIKGLIKALGYQKGDHVREAAADALVQIGAPAVEPLINGLKHEDDQVREAAADALVQIGAPAVEPLINGLKHDDDQVRKFASQTLAKMGKPTAESLIKRYGKNALCWVTQNGNLEVATLLLDYGVDVNACDDTGCTALHFAALSRAEMVALLLGRGADVNARSNQAFTPLFEAVRGPGLETMLLLISHGADVNAHLKGGDTVLDQWYKPITNVLNSFKYLSDDQFARQQYIIYRDVDLTNFIMSGELPPKVKILLEHGAQGNATTMEFIKNHLKHIEPIRNILLRQART
jgi:hypothetical protein